MPINNTPKKTESYSFDFDSIYVSHTESRQPAEVDPSSSYDIPTESKHYSESLSTALTSIEEMAEELREATEKTLLAADDDMDEDDGFTAAEILSSNIPRSKPTTRPV